MIGFLAGQIIYKKAPLLVIEVGGIGYEVLVSMNTFYRVPSQGINFRLYTHLIIREDAHSLYGFINQEERALFRALIRVNGVGPKVALTILSSLSPEDFVSRVHASDITGLTKLPGIGKKMAERLIVEMQDTLKEMQKYTYHPEGSSLTEVEEKHSPSHKNDAISALVALGYKSNDANRAVNHVYQTNMDSETILRKALQKLVNN